MRSAMSLSSTGDGTSGRRYGGLYTGPLGTFRDKSLQTAENRESKVVHSVGNSGYVFGKTGTPSSTGINQSDRISLFYLSWLVSSHGS